MDGFIFFYTLSLILICFAGLAFSLSAWLVSHRKVLLVQIVFFGAYIAEIADIFRYEWSSQNTVFITSSYYEITSPVIRILTGTLILGSLWVMLLSILDNKSKKTALIPPCIFAFASALVVFGAPISALRQFMFYSCRQIFIAFALLYVWISITNTKDAMQRSRLLRYRKYYLVLWVCLACIVAEDTYVILIHPVPTAQDTLLPLYLSERNFSENILMLGVVYFVIKDALCTLALRFTKPPIADNTNEDDLKRHIDDELLSYSSHYGLSNREQEVLALVVEGKNNRAIASELILSEGTIKTHVHNIMKKTNSSSREELRMHFWEG